MCNNVTCYIVLFIDGMSITNINGEEIDYFLVNFSLNTRENMQAYNTDFTNGHDFGKRRKLQPVCVAIRSIFLILQSKFNNIPKCNSTNLYLSTLLSMITKDQLKLTLKLDVYYLTQAYDQNDMFTTN